MFSNRGVECAVCNIHGRLWIKAIVGTADIGNLQGVVNGFRKNQGYENHQPQWK